MWRFATHYIQEAHPMKFYSIYDAEFKPYGQVLEGYDTQEL